MGKEGKHRQKGKKVRKIDIEKGRGKYKVGKEERGEGKMVGKGERGKQGQGEQYEKLGTWKKDSISPSKLPLMQLQE